MTDKPNLLICSYLEPELVERISIEQPGVNVVDAPDLVCRPRYRCDHHGQRPALDDAGRSQWAGLLADADICFDFDWEQPAEMPSRAPRLTWIQATSAGVGEFMTRTRLRESDITVTTAAGVHAVPLTEFVLTGLLHFIKDVPLLQHRQQEHVWQRYTAGALAGRRALVVGLGSIGRQVARTLAALGVEVWGAARPGSTRQVEGLARQATTDELAELLPACDVVVLAVPMTPQTDGLLSRELIGLMPTDAILVNVARGRVVDESALVEALAAKRIAAAALDVAASEPLPPESQLWGLDNVLISPHSASTLASENAVLVDLLLDNLDRFLHGRDLRNRYSPVAGY